MFVLKVNRCVFSIDSSMRPTGEREKKIYFCQFSKLTIFFFAVGRAALFVGYYPNTRCISLPLRRTQNILACLCAMNRRAFIIFDYKNLQFYFYSRKYSAFASRTHIRTSNVLRWAQTSLIYLSFSYVMPFYLFSFIRCVIHTHARSTHFLE